MGLRDVFHFKAEVYQSKVQSTKDTRTLRKKHHMKSVLLVSSGASVGIGIAFAFVTCGATLLGASYSGRQLYVLEKQRSIIEEEFRRRGLEIPRGRKRDVAAGVALGVLSLGLVIFLPIGLHELGGAAASAAMDNNVAPLAATAV